jgi:Tol biopolymer transport system component
MRTHRARKLARLAVAVAAAAALLVPVAGVDGRAFVAAGTELISVNASGTGGGGAVSGTAFFPGAARPGAKISADCRYVVFDSESSVLAAGDANGRRDVFRRDRSGSTQVLTQGNDASLEPSISANGRHVGFTSFATDLVAGEPDTNGFGDVFVEDLVLGTIERVSVSSSGAQADGVSIRARLSADGRYVAFESAAANLVPGDTNSARDVFVRDLQTGVTERVSVRGDGSETGPGGFGAGDSVEPTISADGTRVAWTHHGSVSLAAGVYVRDRAAGTTILVSARPDGVAVAAGAVEGAISPDGRYVAFRSNGDDLVAGERPGFVPDVFLRDLDTGTTRHVTQGDQGSFTPSVSRDGRYVAFESFATDLVAGDGNNRLDVFVRSMADGVTTRASVPVGGGEADGGSADAAISEDGSLVYFESRATNLLSGGSGGGPDVYLHGVPFNGVGCGANDPPVAADAVVTVAEDTPAPVTLAATDADGDALTYGVVTGPQHGTLSGSGASRTYAPHANYHGPDSFTFTANDGKADGNTATVSLTVTPVNDAPVAIDASVTTAEDTPIRLALGGDDVDGDTLTVTVVSGPDHGTLTDTDLYTPAPDYDGPDEVVVRVSDGALHDDGTTAITVTPVDDAPAPGTLVASVVQRTATTPPFPGSAVTFGVSGVLGQAIIPLELLDLSLAGACSRFMPGDPCRELGLVQSVRCQAGPGDPCVGGRVETACVSFIPTDPCVDGTQEVDLLVALRPHPGGSAAPVLRPATLANATPTGFEVVYDAVVPGVASTRQTLHFAIGAGQPLRFANVQVGAPLSPRFHVTFELARVPGAPVEGPLWTVAPSGTVAPPPADTTPPALTVPGDRVVDATRPAGATVGYAVSATDDVDPAPTVACTPAAGSVFPIGTTTVACTATDAAGNAATRTFTVRIRGAAEQLVRLVDKTLAYVDQPALEATLRGRLEAAAAALVARHKAVACTTLALYVAAVRLAPTRLLTAAERAELVADATRIRAVLGC